MVLGGVSCPTEHVRASHERIRSIKSAHRIPHDFEIKWTKVSPSKVPFYLEIVRHFFEDEALRFRGLLIPDKSKLDHGSRGQTHEDWYYKMYFALLKGILSPDERFRIYLDIRDTRGGAKVRKLQDVLCNSFLDFDTEIVETIQILRSHDVQLMQLADLFVGAVGYANRSLESNSGKSAIVEEIRKLSGLSLNRSSLLRARKFNLFRWEANWGGGE
jgi:hypothetical protein